MTEDELFKIMVLNINEGLKRIEELITKQGFVFKELPKII